MPLSELEREQRDLVRRIAQKERDIGHDLELLRHNARQASTMTLAVLAGVGVVVGAFVTWRAFRAFGRPRYVMVR